jgi:hypothetical protein
MAKPRKPFPTSRGAQTGPLANVFDDIWWAWGTTKFLPGTTFSRNMTLLREGADLVAVHPVLLAPDEQAKIDALGPVRHVVRLGDFHGMDNAAYLDKYKATLWQHPEHTPHKGVTAGAELLAGGKSPFADGTLYQFDVAPWPELVLHLRRHGGILLTCDSVQNWETRPAGVSFLGQLMSRAMGFRGRACIGPGWRKQSEPKTGTNFGPKFRELLDLDFRHILSAHGAPLLDTAKDDLRASVDALYP